MTAVLLMPLLSGFAEADVPDRSVLISEHRDAKPDFANNNIELVAGLKGLDECLFRHSVYPAGGVGYRDSSLPYDEYDPVSAAMLQFRAETLRGHSDVVMDVILANAESGVPPVTVVVDSSSPAAEAISVPKLIESNPKIRSAVDVLYKAGLGVDIDGGQVPALSKVCEIEDDLHSLLDSKGKPVTIGTFSDPASGVVKVMTTPEYSEVVSAAASRYSKMVSVEIHEDMKEYGRLDDYPGWNGGDRLHTKCTNSFRVNTSASLTANHCGAPNQSIYNNLCCPSQDYMGYMGYSLGSAKVDAAAIGGSTYSNLVWTGGVLTTTYLHAYGIYPIQTLTTSDYLFFSGSYGGQGTVKYAGVPPNGCITYANGDQVCQLFLISAGPDTCLPGDSGGAVAVYDAANSRLIAAGVEEGGDSPSGNHTCWATSVPAISYLYGGASIG